MDKKRIFVGILCGFFLCISILSYVFYKDFSSGFLSVTPYERDYQLASAEALPPMDLNTITAAQLRKLPGVNAAQAADLIELRESLGRFTDFEQLKTIPSLPDALVLELQKHLYIGEIESTQPAAPRETEESVPEATASTEPLYLNLNTADAADFMRLPGIGEVTANAIIQYRTQLGSFTNRQQLLEVAGIGETTLAGILEYLYIPDEQPLTETTTESSQEPTEPPVQEIPMINLNTATKEELMCLPGCNEAIAQDILELRDGLHEFVNILEINYVESVTPALYESWEPYLTIGDPSPTKTMYAAP